MRFNASPALVLFVLCVIRLLLVPLGVSFGNWLLDGAVLFGALMVAFSILARRLPPQNWVSVVLVFIVALGVGEVLFGTGHSPAACILVLSSTVALVFARVLVQTLLRPWRESRYYGLWLLGLTGVLAGLWTSVLAMVLHPGTPWLSGFIWRAVVSWTALLVATPWLISKHPNFKALEQPSRQEVLAWLGINLLVIVAAATQYMWTAAGLLAAVYMILLGILQCRKWRTPVNAIATPR